MSFKGPNDRVHKMPKTVTITVEIMVALRLLMCFSSTKKATITSSNDIEDVNAAIVSSTKNKIAHNCPNAILWNTWGKVRNTSPGPELGAILKANTAGNMATPASTAIRVSAQITCNDIEVRFSLFLMYEA